MDSSAWSVPEHSMHTVADDEFQQFLDLNGMGNVSDGLGYEFHDFQNSNNTQLLHAPAREQLDTPMSGTDAPMIMSRVDPALQSRVPTITTSAPYQTIPTTMIPPPSPNVAIVDSIDAQIQFLQQQKIQHQQRQLDEQRANFFAYQQNHMVPPTPQSLEIQAGASQYYARPNQAEQHDQHQQQTVNYRYPRLNDRQDMAFTPLVSPAVTPLETHFSVDTQFTVPGAYFSPLTSPAIHAQNDTLAAFDQSISAVPSSSPREIDLPETALPPLPSPAPGDLAKKVRKNAAKARSKAGIKQSPISKPLRRKMATTPNLNAQAVSELVESAEQNRSQKRLSTAQAQTSSSSTTGATDSENGSVSPEALNDMAPLEMPPPPIPKPRSARPSPYIAPQNNAISSPLHALRAQVPSPATPASLMKLSSPNNRTSARTGSQDPMDTDHIENFELPESVSKPDLAPIDTFSTAVQTPQEDPSAKNTSLAPLPSPTSVKPRATASASQSPQLTPASSSSAARKTPLLAPKGGSKKRGSVSSVQVSPALRPKISPNIMPLLPGGVATSEDTASHLLATKSNYQRILEGSMVPGMSYPSELSTNLTSKRTSHKIAEQGRRNRINSALQEIATLLPRPPPKEAKEAAAVEAAAAAAAAAGDGKEKPGSVPNSKASTVELAIEYIKQLQQEVAEANRRAEEAEKKLGL
ncbi:helix-loop-helix DNA-binding domain-containing protein [Apodospora peruviana]|uniref:Helix-loop-helix DNA-binding domain-containing protein n=1 Tax=Apodospora peruviana TaxID=516989 RepID=A0AAE0MFW7_9PEZI|nr:helix-loop-helix DNA-binding domain-containing protein [Apodospora peruviana]